MEDLFDSWYQEVLYEKCELEGKVIRLRKFKNSDKFDDLDVQNREYLDNQYVVMTEYLEILTSRIAQLL